MTVGPPHRARVAELIVTHPAGRRRGSGYRVTADVVLTAAHVVEDALSVEVRFGPDLPGEWSTAALSWQADPNADIAVVSIEPRAGEGRLELARFGRIGDRAAVLEVQAVGFPRWKMRNYDGTTSIEDDGRPRFRDAEHIVGSVAVLSNWREGTLEVVVPTAPESDGKTSPWEGMSGAAVWATDHIIGVIAKHHPGDGLARLAAIRIDRALDALDPEDRPTFTRALHLPESAQLLADAVPPSPQDVLASAYRAQLAEIAPERLRDRDPELGELVGFCAGDQAYAWWQAGPWAGKTALLSWFALHPPAGVEVISFFITTRFADQSDSAAFTDAMIEQLAALNMEMPHLSMAGGARYGHVLRLLQAAAERCVQSGQRLLLLVDGLDEDKSGAYGGARPSIASLLPRRPPAGVRVLVASRPLPDLPGDVPMDHPLRRTRPRQLDSSPHARDVEFAARNELARLPEASPFERDVLGLLTASTGGLAVPDLEELTSAAPYQIDGLLAGAFGRSIATQAGAVPAAGRPGERVYLFAHETLQDTAARLYGAKVSDYRERLHAWAEEYRARGWPPETPAYLLGGYFQVLVDAGDISQLVTFTTDSVRCERMLGLMGGDGQALRQIDTAGLVIAREPRPDLGALLLLVLARAEILARNEHMPADLPAVWAALGEPSRAMALAEGITDRVFRADALQKVVSALVAAGDHDRAASLAAELEAFARGTTAPESGGAWMLAAAAIAVAAAGDLDRADRLRDEKITDPEAHTWALCATAEASVQAGRGSHVHLAELVTGNFSRPDERARALSMLAMAAAAAGDRLHAAELATKAEAAADSVFPEVRADTLGVVAAAFTAAGDIDHARQLVSPSTDPPRLSAPLASLLELVTGPGRDELVSRLIAPIQPSAWGKSRFALALAVAGDKLQARAVAIAAESDAREIADPEDRARALSMVATALAAAGEPVLARQAAVDAESAARGIDDPAGQVWRLGNLAAALAATGDDVRVERIVTIAKRIANDVADRTERDEALGGLNYYLALIRRKAPLSELPYAATWWFRQLLADKTMGSSGRPKDLFDTGHVDLPVLQRGCDAILARISRSS